MKQILTILLVLFLNAFSLNAQETENLLHLELVTTHGVKKELKGNCFALSMIKAKKLYQVIVIDKALLTDSKEIKVFLQQENKTEPYAITIQIDNKNVIKSDKLVAIPFIMIREQLQITNTVIHYPVFALEDFIPENMNGITDKDVEALKRAMEKWLYR